MPASPILDFAHAAVSCLPRRKQRVLAVYYVGVLATTNERTLRRAVPAHAYRPLRHFLSSPDWDGRELVWRAAARVLPTFEIEWLSCRVTTVASKYSFAWLAAHGPGDACVVLDLKLIGPARLIRQPADLTPPQLELLQTLPDDLLRRAPLSIADALAEGPAVRAALAARGVTYSARLLRPERSSTGTIRTSPGRQLTIAGYAEQLRSTETVPDSNGVEWARRAVKVEPTVPGLGPETLVLYWHDGHLADAVLTNEHDAARLADMYDPSKPTWLARARRLPPWSGTSLRTSVAWEHHLALSAVLFAAQVAVCDSS